MNLAALVLVGLLASPACAIVTPDAATTARLNGLLADAKRAFSDFEAAKSRGEDSTILGQFRDERDATWKKVVDATLIAYDLSRPSMEDPDAARRPKMRFEYGRYAGETRDWVITFQDLPFGEHIAEQTDLNASKRRADQRRDSNAITMDNGTTVIFKPNYSSAAELARTLFHERIHFRQYAEAKYAHYTIPEREVEAWTAVVDNLDAFGFSAAEAKKQRSIASDMVVRESLKSITARGQRNLKVLGAYIKGRLQRGDGDTQEVQTTKEGFTLDLNAAEEIRKDAQRLNESVDSAAAARKLEEIAAKSCERRWRRSWLEEQYAAIRRPTSPPEVVPGDSCAAGVFDILWSAKASDQVPDWGAVDALVSDRSHPPALGCTPSGGIPCPVAAAPVRAVSPPQAAAAAQAARQTSAARAAARDPFSTLAYLANKGCSDPWAQAQDSLDRSWAEVRGMSFDDGAAARMGLSGCNERLFLGLMRMAVDRNPERMTMDLFARTAEGARVEPGAEIIDDMPDVPGTQSPTVPTCRHHSWCREWTGR